MKDFFNVKSGLNTPSGKAAYFNLQALESAGIAPVSRLPISIKVLLESVLRNCNNSVIHEQDVINLAQWSAKNTAAIEVPFKPARVILQDFTGVPSLVDLAAMRSAMQRLGGDPSKIEPLIPCDLVIDHSVQIDSYGNANALAFNMKREFERNSERYEFLKWGQGAFKKFGVVPPGVGIIHQVNLEYFARGVFSESVNGETILYPDSLVGTDSHTTMINGLGIVGWGVGGIEAEAVMLGQPIYMLAPQVVGFKLTGEPADGATATDIALRVVEMLRQKGVVGKFVEFYGPGVSAMSLPDRATIANMAPEYGATMGFFPMDDESLNYMRRTGRPDDLIDLVERYAKEQGLFLTHDSHDPEFSDTLHLDLATVEPSLAGPKRPQDRIRLSDMQKSFQDILTAPVDKRGFNLDATALANKAKADINGGYELTHGAVVIASITSCTNTSNPSVMLGAGLIAQKAVDKGLKVPAYVKTSLAPGSRVVTDYLNKSGLTESLEKLGFQTVGYGCATCIGNSGPLPEPVAEAITTGDLVAASVLSGNRNFEGRVNPLTKANYLASPPLVVAYAIAGTVDINLDSDPLGTGSDGNPVYLKDIWPSRQEILDLINSTGTAEAFREIYSDVNAFSEDWQDIPVTDSPIYPWREDSSYIQEPPFFIDMEKTAKPVQPIEKARVLALLGDSVTTDHISPAGAIPVESPAGEYLQSLDIEPRDFNSFGSRRGNDRVMVRGTFGNIRLKNLLAPGTEGGITKYLPTGEQTWIYDAAQRYKADNTPLIVLAGKEYGTGSSRDWAAKGTLLLGVRAVLAESFERIHRSNLVGMGVLPLQFVDGESPKSLGLTGHEQFTVQLPNDPKPMQQIDVLAESESGDKTFKVVLRLDTPVEIDYYRQGGILHKVLRDML